MCKRAYRREQMVAAAGGYEGQTMRMDSLDEPRSERRHMCWSRGFPWWTLWLIWPLIGLLRWAASLSTSALATFRDNIGAFDRPATALVALALIIVGLALIRRESHGDGG